MNNERKAVLTKYIVVFCIASLITLAVFWIKGFFTDNVGVNIQVLSDGFCVSGILLLLFAGMMFVSGEGALIGVSFVLRNVVLAFIPMGRARHETYAQYRERKLANPKKSGDHCVLVVGCLFFAVGIIFTIIWYTNYYNVV